MQCVDVTEQLLEVDELGSNPELDRHVRDCSSCAYVARGLHRLDDLVSTVLVVAPPLDLQRQLAQIAFDAARTQPVALPWWRRLGELNLTEWLMQRPQMVAAQGLAALMLVLAGWQVFGWVTAFQPVVGDVGYAMELVVGSPAGVYLGGLQLDLQNLGLWSLVGICGWLLSEDGLIGRRLWSRRQRQP